MCISSPLSKFSQTLRTLNMRKCLHPTPYITMRPLLLGIFHGTIKLSPLLDLRKLGRMSILFLEASYHLSTFADHRGASWWGPGSFEAGFLLRDGFDAVLSIELVWIVNSGVIELQQRRPVAVWALPERAFALEWSVRSLPVWFSSEEGALTIFL